MPRQFHTQTMFGALVAQSPWRNAWRDGPAASFGSLAVESVMLMKSELGPTGSVYTKLWEMRLSGS
ncbi:MAG: hypothetical protein ACT4OO_00965 [Nitrospiraceae bacterium]